MLFFYVRHGFPTYKPDALTPLGVEQARAIAKRFVTYGLDQIYTSSSTRAMQTAEPTCELLRIEPVVYDWAHESLAFADFSAVNENGKKTWADCCDRYIRQFNSADVLALGNQWYTHPAFSDTNFAAGIARVDRETDAFFLKLGYKHIREENRFEKVGESPERVAFFAHAGFGKAFLCSILGIPYPIFCTHFDMSHTGMTVIHFDDRSDFVYPHLLQYSNDAHLYREGIMAGYESKPKLKF